MAEIQFLEPLLLPSMVCANKKLESEVRVQNQTQELSIEYEYLKILQLSFLIISNAKENGRYSVVETHISFLG